MPLYQTTLHESPIAQLYYETTAGLLVPNPISFAGDSFRTPAALQLLAQEAHIIGIQQEHIDVIITEGLHTLDEILAVADPLNSFGTVLVERRGFYLPETKHYLNSEVLQDLYCLLSHPLFKDLEPTEHFHRLQEAWAEVQRRHFDHYEVLPGSEYPLEWEELRLKEQ